MGQPRAQHDPRDDIRYCPQALTKGDYMILQKADIASGGRVGGVLSRNGHASWTVCPRCRVDDFVHVEGCPLAPKAK